MRGEYASCGRLNEDYEYSLNSDYTQKGMYVPRVNDGKKPQVDPAAFHLISCSDVGTSAMLTARRY